MNSVCDALTLTTAISVSIPIPVMANASSEFGSNSAADTSTGDPLDCLITSLQSGEELSYLRATPSSSASMTTASRERPIPAQATPKKRRQEDADGCPHVGHAPASVPPSDCSSSVYSERSSLLAGTESGDTTMSSFRADDILTPKPLNLTRGISMQPAISTPSALEGHTSSEGDSNPSTRVAPLPESLRPQLAVQSHLSSDSESESLIKDIVRYPMVETSPHRRLPPTTSPSANFFVNQKAARLLGLDGAGSPVTPTTPVFSEVLKDITNKEPTSSPRTLRNIASKLSLSGRKKSSQQEKELAALGKIEEQVPSNLPEMAAEADKWPEASGSISRRRGFRPLSIHTGKAFDPFGCGGSLKPDWKDGKTADNAPQTIEADFTILTASTPPNIRHHPVFQRDPFSQKSPSPLLKTTSSPLQIRQSLDRTSLGQSSSKRSSNDSKSGSLTSKKKLLFDTGLRAPNEKDIADPLDLILSGSPLPRTRTSGTPRESLSVALLPHGEPRKSTSSDLHAASTDSTRRSRGISGWFRQRDKSAEPNSKESHVVERRSFGEAAREAQVAYLRKLYDAPSPDYDFDDPYPRHPTTGRSWHARNLKCTICRDHLCSCCGRPCCAYRQAYMTWGNPLSTAQIKEQAFGRMDQINRLFPDGRELPTFLQCTSGGGCGRYVCPTCVGMCPLSICRDTQCRDCKQDPWAICDFHDEEQTRFCQDRAA